nr:hypothetical protein [Bacteroidota bacterium]
MEGLFDDFHKTKPYADSEQMLAEAFVPLPDETITYQSPGELPEDTTIPVGLTEKGFGPEETERYQATPNSMRKTISHNLGKDDIIELNSIKYHILNIISDEGKTGEAVIYKVKNQHDKIFALKLYYEFNDAHLEPSPDTLQRIREISGNEILNLFDFGTGPNKYQGRYCFEITDYAAGGDLLSVEGFSTKYTDEFIERVIIPGVYSAIRSLHLEKIYHCDLKPQNVFYFDQEQTRIVIGDFGSAKSFEKTSEKELSHTTITKGTEFYLAPEQAFGIVSEKNDYYSFGMIILHLLYPDQVTRKNLRKIFERRTKGVRIIDFDKKYEKLNQLIEGLTLQDYNSRWGENEVSNWISGASVRINYRATENRNYLKIGESLLYTGKDLADYIGQGNSFYEALIEDKEGFLTLLRWIHHLQGESNKTLFDGMITHYKNYFGIDYVREAILFYFSPARTFDVGATTFQFNNSKEIVENTEMFFKRLDELWKISDLSAIRLFFFQFEFALQQVRIKAQESVKNLIDGILERITRIIGVSVQKDFLDYKASLFIELKHHHLIDLFHEFDPGRKFLDFDNHSYDSLTEIFAYFKERPGMLENENMQQEKRGYLKHILVDDLVDFVRTEKDFVDFLFSREEDFYIVANVMARLCSQEYDIDFIRGFLLFYQKFEREIFRSALLIVLQPEYPIEFGDININFFEKGNFANKVREFFKKLDEIWIDLDFKTVQLYVFKFELSLLRIARNDNIAYKTMVKPVLDAIESIVHDSPGDISQLRANLFKLINENILLDLFYRFIPARTFKASSMLSLDTLHDIGVFYVNNPELYNNRAHIIEKEAFIKRFHHRAFAGLNYNDFILKVFKDHIKIEVQTVKVIFDEPSTNEATVVYNFSLSLSEYFQENGIGETFIETSVDPESVVIKKGQIVKDEILYGRFTEAILQKHVIKDVSLSGSSQESFLNALEQKKRVENIREYTFIPYYILFLLPVFGVLIMVTNYLLQSTSLKDITFDISPALSLVSTRLPRTNLAVMVVNAYVLNFFIGFFLWFTLLILKGNATMFEKFVAYHGRLINHIMVYFIVAPVLFLAIYFVADQIVGDVNLSGGNSNPIFSLQGVVLLLYVLFILRYLIKIVNALFKSYKKFRIMPLLVSVIFYVILGYISLLHQNLVPGGN